MQDSCCVCFDCVVYFSTIIVMIPNYSVNYEVGKKEVSRVSPLEV